MKSTESLLVDHKISPSEEGPETSATESSATESSEEKTQPLPQEEGGSVNKDLKESDSSPEETNQLAHLEQRLQETRRWANKAHEDKTKLYKKLQDLADAGHVDLEELKEIEAPQDDPLAEFWTTVDTQIQGYATSFGTQEPQQYLASFKAYLRDLATDDPNGFKQLEEEVSLLPSSAWVKFVLDKGKTYWQEYGQYLEGKTPKLRLKELLEANQKLQKQLENVKKTETHDLSAPSSQERPLLSGHGRTESLDAEPSMVATDHLLDHHRQKAVRR